MALNNIKHILIATSFEDSIEVNENDPEENEESVTEDEKIKTTSKFMQLTQRWGD